MIHMQYEVLATMTERLALPDAVAAAVSYNTQLDDIQINGVLWALALVPFDNIHGHTIICKQDEVDPTMTMDAAAISALTMSSNALP